MEVMVITKLVVSEFILFFLIGFFAWEKGYNQIVL